MVDLTTLQAFNQMPCAVHAEEEAEVVLHFLLTPVLALTQRMKLQTMMEMDAPGMNKAPVIDVDNSTLMSLSQMSCAVDVVEVSNKQS